MYAAVKPQNYICPETSRVESSSADDTTTSSWIVMQIPIILASLHVKRVNDCNFFTNKQRRIAGDME